MIPWLSLSPDLAHECLAMGGELHADAEALLLEAGSNQSDLWGGNFFPWHPHQERLEYTSFINIRPADDNASMEILDEEKKNMVRLLVERFLLSPDEIMKTAEP